MIRRIFVAFLFFTALSTYASDNIPEKSVLQNKREPEKREYYWFNPRVSVLIPNSLANRALKKSFIGVYEVSTDLNMMLFKGLFIGGTYKTGEYKLKGVTGQAAFDYNPIMKQNNVGIKVGNDEYIGERNKIIFSAALSIGRNWTTFKGLRCVDVNKSPKITGFSANFIEPEIGFYFLIENNIAIGATMSYSIISRVFEPTDFCLDQWQTYGKVGNSPMQFFNFGFGIHYSFLKKKNQ